MGGKYVVVDRRSRNIGLFIQLDHTDRKVSSDYVAWGPETNPVPVSLSGTINRMPLFSLRLIDFINSEGAKKLWDKNPQIAVILALAQKAIEVDGTASQNEIAAQLKLAGIHVDARTLRKLLNDLVLTGAVRMAGEPNKYAVEAYPTEVIPAELRWMIDAKHPGNPGSGVPGFEVPGRHLASEPSITPQDLPKRSKTNEALSHAQIFLDLLQGFPAERSAPFAYWLRKAWEAAGDVEKLLVETITVAGQSFEDEISDVLLLIPPVLIRFEPPASGSIRKNQIGPSPRDKMISKSLPRILAKYHNRNMLEKPWLLQSAREKLPFDLSTLRPAELLNVFKVLADEYADSPLSTQIRESLILNKAFKTLRTDIVRGRPEEKDDRLRLLGKLFYSAPWGASAGEKPQVIISAFESIPEGVTLEEFLVNSTLENLIELVEMKQSRIQTSDINMAVAQRVSQLVRTTHSPREVVQLLQLTFLNGIPLSVEITPDAIGKLRSAFRAEASTATPANRALVDALTGEANVGPLEKQLQATNQRLLDLETQLNKVQTEYREVSAQAARLQKALDETVENVKVEQQRAIEQAYLPLLKNFALALQIATELIGSDSGSMSRLMGPAHDLGLEVIGKVGELVVFDPKEHLSPGGNLSLGVSAEVIASGFMYKFNGSKIVIVKAIVK